MEEVLLLDLLFDYLLVDQGYPVLGRAVALEDVARVLEQVLYLNLRFHVSQGSFVIFTF